MTNFERAKRFRMARTELNRNGGQTLLQVHEATGLSVSSLSNLENPELGRTPSQKSIDTLAAYYGVSGSWLSGHSASPSLDPDIQMVTDFTGLTIESLRILRNLTREEVGRRLINSFIQAEEFTKLIYTAQTIHRSAKSNESGSQDIDYMAAINNTMKETEAVVFSEKDMTDYQMWKMQRLAEQIIRKAVENDP